MSTPPKAPCHSCNGTGIDPTVGFLDCELCTPAYTGVSLSAPQQPEPNCSMCNDHGEIGALRPDGYDSEPCPDCTPATAKEELDAVLHWRGKHAQAIRERDALQLLLNDRDEKLHTLEHSRRAEFDNGQAAEQRVEDLTELLNKALMAIKRTYQAGRDRIVDMGGDCDGVEYMMNSDLTVQEIRTALKAAAETCQFPQSCTTRCDCDIPDFSPGNGNKARRRAESIKAMSPCQQPQAHPARCGCEERS